MSDLHIELCETIAAEACCTYDQAAELLEDIPQWFFDKIRSFPFETQTKMIIGYLFETVIDA